MRRKTPLVGEPAQLVGNAKARDEAAAAKMAEHGGAQESPHFAHERYAPSSPHDGTGPLPHGLTLYRRATTVSLVQIYSDTLNLVVFAGLDSLGVDTSKGRAWLEERSGA
jgi:hypothetical protein